MPVIAPAAPPAVADYFARYDALFPADYVLTIVSLFVPGPGWTRLAIEQQVPITVAWAQGALAAGATAVRVGWNGIYADFQLTELA